NSPRSASSETPEKISPRVVRQLKSNPRYSEPTASSSNLAPRGSRERSPKVAAAEVHYIALHYLGVFSTRFSCSFFFLQKEQNGKVEELESQISLLENDLKVVKDQLSATEQLKKQAEEEAEESKQKLLALSEKLPENSVPGEDPTEEPESVEKPQQQQQVRDSSTLASALDEIQKLKAQLDLVSDSEAIHLKKAEAEKSELQQVKESLSQTLALVEDMETQLRETKESELHAHKLVEDTLARLEEAKRVMETLKSDGLKASESYHSDRSEEERAEIEAARVEISQLRSALEASEKRYSEERDRSTEQSREAVEMVDKIRAESVQREAVLELELRKSKDEIDELRANLMDKETELQAICEENEVLATKLEQAFKGTKELQLEKELQKLKSDSETLRALLAEKESLFESASDENRRLKSEEVVEADHPTELRHLTEEVEKSNKRAARATEQLEAAQASNAEMEGELRRLKVQSDQWRKAAEAAAAMITAGANGQVMERTGSMDSHFSPRIAKVGSPFGDDLEDELMKKKNPNMLTRLWKKPQK
ncbi:hypothetical protein M569_11752, partial [Genlisea aurea]